MPGRWESSERPLFVRTVWIKGIRHVVLSKNDPLLQQMVEDIQFESQTSMPISESATCAAPPSPPSPISVLSMTPLSVSPFTPSSSDAPDLVLNECQSTFETEQDLNRHAKTGAAHSEELRKNGATPNSFYSANKSDGKGSTKARKLFLPVGDTDTAVARGQGVGNMVRLEQNPLSDRVMKWLDLSGKSLLETTVVDEKTTPDKSGGGKKWRGGRHVKKFMKHRSASLNIINTQYDMTLTADMRIEGSQQPKNQQSVHFQHEHVKPEEEVSAKMNKMYELKRSNSVIPLPLTPDCSVNIRPTTTDGTTNSAKTKLHIFVPLICAGDSLSEENEEYL